MYRLNKGWEFQLFFLIALILVAAIWPVIDMINYETSDFASNSLLIQQAKSFQLLEGNYSRVGFSHPGPALIYMLAFGEWFFYDTLHIVKSAFSGQLIAVALYNALWILLICKVLYKITSSIPATLLATSTFLLGASLLDYHLFNGIWFPLLYFFPFAVMLVSSSRLLEGRADSLLALALSAGFLINGHVCFIAIAGIMFPIILVVNYILYRNKIGHCLVKKDFFIANKRSLLIFLAILLLFLAPLIILTIMHFPGPIANYLNFGQKNSTNTFMQALNFVLVYWGGMVPFLIATIFLVCIYLTKFASTEFCENINSLLIIFLAASISMVLYAKFGIDFLEQHYIGIFYYSIPAFTLCLAFVYLYKILTLKNKRLLAVGFSLLFLCWTFVNIKKPHGSQYMRYYNDPTIVELYDLVNKAKSDRPLVFNLEDEAQIWTTILGLNIYAIRNHNDLFCIYKNWNIKYSKPSQCTMKELANQPIYIVKSSSTESLAPPDIQYGNLSFYKTPAIENIVNRGYISISQRPDLFNIFLFSGWSGLESDFVWSEAKQTHLFIPVQPNFSGTLTLDLMGFIPAHDTTQNISIYVNDHFITSAEFTANKMRQDIIVPIKRISTDFLDVKLIIKDPISPQKIGLSDDPRKLGVALYGLQIEEN